LRFMERTKQVRKYGLAGRLWQADTIYDRWLTEIGGLEMPKLKFVMPFLVTPSKGNPKIRTAQYKYTIE
jgi:hypothetical protein